MQYRISVVVPTYKRPDLLHRCLSAITRQDLDPSDYEIIIVDDAACESTRQQVASWIEYLKKRAAHSCSFPMIRYISVSGSTHGPAVARNVGWRAARGEIIAFTDDDCIPMPGWLSAGLAAFSPGVVGVSGKLVMPLEHIPTDYERDAVRLEKSEFVTANCFYRRDILERVGGFDENFTSAWREDSDLFFTILEYMQQFDCTDSKYTATIFRRLQGTEGERVSAVTSYPFTASAAIHSESIAREPARQDRRSESALPAALDYVPRAIVIHPVRPASWGISLKQQRKSIFNALLYKKHPRLYRQRVQAMPPWHYYCIVGALLATMASILAGSVIIALGAFTVWVFLTGRFCLQRLRHTSHAPSHILEMIVTSMLIPPLSIFWRIAGAIRFRVFFL